MKTISSTRANSTELMLARIDERVSALHEHVQLEVKPLLAQVGKLAEAVTWLKAGVIAIYGSLAGFALHAIMEKLLN